MSLVSAAPDDVSADWIESGRCRRIPATGLRGTPSAFFDSLAGDPPDVIHLHGPWDLSNATIAHEARRRGIPYVVSAHGMLDDWSMQQRGLKKWLYLKLVGRKFLESAAVRHCTAEAEAQQAGRWAAGKEKWWTEPCFVDLRPFEQLPGPQAARAHFGSVLGDGEPILVFLSRLHEKKRPEVLVEASRLLAAHKPHRLVLAGTGNEAYIQGLKRLIAPLPHAHLVGHVDGDLKLSLLQAADLFVLPTSQENFGIVFAEAMACGTPAVATRGVDIWRNLEKGGAAILDVVDPDRLAALMAKLLVDQKALVERGELSRSYIFQWLDPERLARRYATLYQAAANAPTPPGRPCARR